MAFRLAISIDPQYALAHHNLGVLLRQQGLLNEAIESYTRATSIQPDYVDAHYNLGNALMDLGNLDAAVASYHKALAIDPPPLSWSTLIVSKGGPNNGYQKTSPGRDRYKIAPG